VPVALAAKVDALAGRWLPVPETAGHEAVFFIFRTPDRQRVSGSQDGPQTLIIFVYVPVLIARFQHQPQTSAFLMCICHFSPGLWNW